LSLIKSNARIFQYLFGFRPPERIVGITC
jgi:hypothetical protein